MKDLTQYISEKLKINKNTHVVDNFTISDMLTDLFDTFELKKSVYKKVIEWVDKWNKGAAFSDYKKFGYCSDALDDVKHRMEYYISDIYNYNTFAGKCNDAAKLGGKFMTNTIVSKNYSFTLKYNDNENHDQLLIFIQINGRSDKLFAMFFEYKKIDEKLHIDKDTKLNRATPVTDLVLKTLNLNAVFNDVHEKMKKVLLNWEEEGLKLSDYHIKAYASRSSNMNIYNLLQDYIMNYTDFVTYAGRKSKVALNPKVPSKEEGFYTNKYHIKFRYNRSAFYMSAEGPNNDIYFRIIFERKDDSIDEKLHINKETKNPNYTIKDYKEGDICLQIECDNKKNICTLKVVRIKQILPKEYIVLEYKSHKANKMIRLTFINNKQYKYLYDSKENGLFKILLPHNETEIFLNDLNNTDDYTLYLNDLMEFKSSKEYKMTDFIISDDQITDKNVKEYIEQFNNFQSI